VNISRRLQEQFGYAYDAAWNLNARTNNALVQRFNVNTLNELTTATNSGTLTVAGTTTEPAADVTSMTVNSVTASEYADGTFAAAGFTPANGNNTYTAIAGDTYGRWDTNSVTVYLPATNTYSYDSNGNLLSDGTRHFTYDDENQLTSVWVTNTWREDCVYDGLLRKRIEKDFAWQSSAWLETNEVRFVYDGNLVIQERDQNNLPEVTYTRGNDLSGSLQGAGGIGGLLARTDMGLWTAGSGQATAFYHADGNGNITCLVNTNGMVLAHYEYDPFGSTISMSGPLAGANRYRFSSKEWNDNAGLYYYGLRFYDPNLQRWLNRDPIGEDGGINLYEFLSNDPMYALDPYGLALFGLYDSWGDYWSDVGNTFAGEAKGAGANLSFGLYTPCYRNSLQKQGGYVGQGLAMAGETLAGGAGLVNGAGRAGLGQLEKQGLKDFAEQKYLAGIGKKVLTPEKYAKYFDKDPVQMGRNIIKGEGKLGALKPTSPFTAAGRAGYKEAFGKGLTPELEMALGTTALGAAAKNAIDLSRSGGANSGGCQ